MALKLLHLKSCGPQSIRLKLGPETLDKRVNSINFKKDNWLDCAAKQSNRHKLAPNLSAGCRVSRQHKPNKKGNKNSFRKFLNDPQRSGYHSARHGRQNPTVSCRINFGLRLSLATWLLVARQCGSSNQPPDIYSRNDKCSGGRMTRTALHTSRFCRKCPSFFKLISLLVIESTLIHLTRSTHRRNIEIHSKCATLFHLLLLPLGAAAYRLAVKKKTERIF